MSTHDKEHVEDGCESDESSDEELQEARSMAIELEVYVFFIAKHLNFQLIKRSAYLYIEIKYADIREDVLCPICLGIIRKTKTMMECMHRFCGECIEKAMRLGNNECPSCRRHCPSRRAFREDPNFDALVALLFPDIDKFEAEELAFQEEEIARNKQNQESISLAFKRQAESQGKKRPSAIDSPSPHQRSKRLDEACSSLDISVVDISEVGEETEIDEAERESMGAVAQLDSLTEGVEMDEDDQLEIHIMLVSIEKQRIPGLEQPDIYCKLNLLVRQLSQVRFLDSKYCFSSYEILVYISNVSIVNTYIPHYQYLLFAFPTFAQYVSQETEVQADEIEIYLVKELHSQGGEAVSADFAFSNPSLIDLSKDKMQALDRQATLADIIRNYNISDGKMVLGYDKRELEGEKSESDSTGLA
ncbi:putative E3 ubiquitin-protein ligase RING1b [Tripterygium wilfordii]|uniref:putative E3 ubiquitin-protein ligase RING1b n=1 Tax=Tripterygium wilfordii TaxID=458696 RepID=UPI0018F7ED07|nr:putative E3 ubiquitin-protein ligase RING1b [Tripterygium wilfordii]